MEGAGVEARWGRAREEEVVRVGAFWHVLEGLTDAAHTQMSARAHHMGGSSKTMIKSHQTFKSCVIAY
jgi:hypothetical protein